MRSRRITLKIGLALPLALGWPGSPRAWPGDRLSDKLRRLFRRPAAAAAIGARLGRGALPETELGAVVARVRERRGGLPAIADDTDQESLRAALRERTCDDFRAGRTLWFEGWLLAETEARLLLIAHLASAS